jgi:hypothetical protein
MLNWSFESPCICVAYTRTRCWIPQQAVHILNSSSCGTYDHVERLLKSRRPSVCLHVTTTKRLNGFPSNIVFLDFTAKCFDKLRLWWWSDCNKGNVAWICLRPREWLGRESPRGESPCHSRVSKAKFWWPRHGCCAIFWLVFYVLCYLVYMSM